MVVAPHAPRLASSAIFNALCRFHVQVARDFIGFEEPFRSFADLFLYASPEVSMVPVWFALLPSSPVEDYAELLDNRFAVRDDVRKLTWRSNDVLHSLKFCSVDRLGLSCHKAKAIPAVLWRVANCPSNPSPAPILKTTCCAAKDASTRPSPSLVMVLCCQPPRESSVTFG